MCSKLECVPCQIQKTTKNHPREAAKKCVERIPLQINAVARKTLWKGIKENTLQ